MNKSTTVDHDRDITTLVRGIGQRLKHDLPFSERVPFKIALLLEHLRRSEEHGQRGAGNS
jgi:hypothetical protein